MKESRKDKKQELLREEIKQTARKLMVTQGTAGISIREIAREMGITAPGLYYYFPNLEALITALLEDAFNALADALETANHSSNKVDEQLMAVATTYRSWAIGHPTDFQLIYGNPIPGYVAPREVTVPAVIRSFRVLVELFAKALEHSEPTAPEYRSVPSELEAHLTGLQKNDGYAVPILALYLALVLWTRMHGIVMLELFHHLQAGVGNPEIYYQIQIKDTFRAMGLKA